MFPAAFPQPPVVQTQATNIDYQGWGVEQNRLIFANGLRKRTVAFSSACPIHKILQVTLGEMLPFLQIGSTVRVPLHSQSTRAMVFTVQI